MIVGFPEYWLGTVATTLLQARASCLLSGCRSSRTGFQNRNCGDWAGNWHFPWGLQVMEGERREGATSRGRSYGVGAQMCISHLLPANFLRDFNALLHGEASITTSGVYLLQSVGFMVERQWNLTLLPTYWVTLDCLLSLCELQAHP